MCSAKRFTFNFNCTFPNKSIYKMSTADIPELIDENSPATTTAKAVCSEQLTASTNKEIPKNQQLSLDSDNENDDDDEEIEMEVDSEPTSCLFCSEIFAEIDSAITHLLEAHHVCLTSLKRKFDMDQYSYIKMVNCIRSEHIGDKQLANAEAAFWLDEKYLKPAKYEPWLSYDFEELQTNETDAVAEPMTRNELMKKVIQQAEALRQANKDILKMKAYMQSAVGNKESSKDAKEKPSPEPDNTLQNDKEYFSGYAHFAIHHEMLADEVRTSSYRDALQNNADFVKGKSVLDVGCGTSVLSIFASRAGASQVVGIDNSEIIFNAMSIIQLNKIKNVTLIKGRLENTTLPVEQFDIIISEWMGYFLFFEGMLDTIIYARDRHLKPGGIILPNRCTLSLVGYGSRELYSQHIGFWDNVYDVNMSTMRENVLHEPLVEVVDPEYILTKATTMSDVNMATVDLNYSNFTHNFELKCTKTGTLNAFVGYFDTYFDLPEPIMFGTGPTETPTHWKQVVFFIEQPRTVKAGEVVRGKFVCRRLRDNARSLDIAIEVFDKRQTYYLD